MTNDNFVMPVAPTGNGYGNDDFGLGNSGWWIIILLAVLGWGNGGFGNGFGGGYGGMFPWMMGGQMNTNNDVQRGFDQSAIMGGISGIQNAVTSGFGNVQTALCSGFAGVNAGIANGFAQAEIANNARQIADMQQMFGIQSALQNCCCENRSNIADLKYTVATENCAGRTASAQNTRDIIDNQTRGIQTILDKLCALELDGVKGQLAQAQRDNVALQNQLNMATLRESQTAQNAFIQQGFSNEVDALYNRLNNCPVPSTPVYGRTPIFTCSGNGYGCGCGAA